MGAPAMGVEVSPGPRWGPRSGGPPLSTTRPRRRQPRHGPRARGRGRSILATVATVHIEGVPFSVEEAAEFATRTRTYVGANPELLTPGEALAAQLEHRAAEYGDVVVELTDEEKAAAAAVLQDWRRAPDVPAAARALYAALAPG